VRVCLDARKLWDSGIGTYIRGLLAGFREVGAEMSWDLLVPPGGAALPECPAARIHHCGAGNYSLGELFQVSRQANRSGADLFHAPHYVIPLGLKPPLVVTVHDLIHLKFPRIFSPLQRAYARWMLSRVKRQARVVLTPSQWTRSDLLNDLGYTEDRVVVTYNGIDERFFQRVEPESLEAFRRRRGLPDGYLLYVGNLKPHKNVDGLLEAWSRLAASRRPPLVITGPRTEEYPALQGRVHALGRPAEVIFTGAVATEDLPSLYQGALACVQPSWYEGFGLPPLEAMAGGVPTVVSNRASLPEVAGPAALVFDPGKSDEMTAALESIITDEELRRRLSRSGPERARTFTWRRCAQQTLEAYRRIIAG